MKKIFLLSILLMSICGCASENKDIYADFEHYDLTNYETNEFIYIGNDGIKDKYLIADITPENYEAKVAGVFYKLSDSDYILLDKFENGDPMSETYNYQYENKLYVTACNSMCHYEYTLDRDNTSKKELNFDVSEVGNQITIYYPLKVEQNTIYYHAKMYDSTIDIDYWGKEYILKCDLETYKCIEEQEM